jgi:hypothetical protein
LRRRIAYPSQKRLRMTHLVSCAVLILMGSNPVVSLFAQSVPGHQEKASKEQVREVLSSPSMQGLYARTYWSLKERRQSDGFLPESLTGAYQGMFPRTVGAYALLMTETRQYEAAEQSVACVLTALRQNDDTRVPRVIGKHGSAYYIEDDEAQIDGQAQLILGWARLALARGRTPFEDRTWKQVSDLLSSGTDRPYLQYGQFPSQNGLVRNVAFEHSREGRFWDTWDLLTQSFMGAALHDMVLIAKRRGETEAAAVWQKRLDILSGGMMKSLTTERDGQETYLEMRLPNSAAGVPYMGMGWVVLSPLAAGWTPDVQVLSNTVSALERTNLKTTHGQVWMPTDGYADGTFSNEIIGKGQAWEMEYARTHDEWTRVTQILNLINTVNAPSLYMEGAWLENSSYHLSQRLSDSDLPGLEHATWKVKDAGNGEQDTWFCWEMARLRQQFGLPVEPPQPPAN